MQVLRKEEQMQEDSNSVRSETTCWSLIHGAATGDRVARDEFARLYHPVVLGFLRSRWAKNLKSFDLDDALQDVFVDCFKPDGALQRWEAGRDGGFRGFLYGIVRNVALRHEQKRRNTVSIEVDYESDQTGVEKAFDRAWARSIMKEAARLMAEHAEVADGHVADANARTSKSDVESGVVSRAMRRVQLLKKRFNENLPIREIASQWGVDPVWLHHEYAIARKEFHTCLLQLISFHNPQATPLENQQACRDLLALLQ